MLVPIEILRTKSSNICWSLRAKKFHIMLSITVLCIANNWAIASYLLMPQKQENEHYSTAFTKTQNISYYYNKLYVNQTFSLFNIEILNNYTASVIQLKENNEKDEESLMLSLRQGLTNSFSLSLDNYLQYASDSRSIGNSTLSDVLILPGLEYKLDDITKAKLFTGYNFTKKVNVAMKGIAFGGELSVNDYSLFSNVIYSLATKYLQSNFTNKRDNHTFYIDNSLSNIIDEHNGVSLGINYRNNSQDYINFTNGENSDYIFEKNNNGKLESKLEINYSPVDFIFLRSAFAFDDNSRNIVYSEPVSTIKNSLFNRSSSFKHWLIELSSLFQFELMNLVFSADYDANREEYNATSASTQLNERDINDFLAIQRFNNFTSSKLRANIANSFAVTRRDSLSLFLSASIYRYDTPTDGNNDDYDESYSALYLSYKHRFDKSNAYRLIFEAKNRHNAFLKAEKSAQSNSLKTIRLASQMNFFHSSLYELNPTVDISANYNVYDFVLPGNKQNTYSFRQISYADSAIFWINKHNNANVILLLRYSERGFLDWDSFSELPMKANIEQVYKLIFYNSYDDCTFGLGGSYYSFDLNDLVQSKSEQNSYIYSPEAHIKYKFSENGYLYFNGKYDFQNVKGNWRNYANIAFRCELLF